MIGIESNTEETFDYEYIDLSGKNLGIEGIIKVFEDLAEDDLIKHVDLSHNIALEEFQPSRALLLYKMMKLHLSKNKTLRALDFGGNNLFYFLPHPSNEHLKNYLEEITDCLCTTSIEQLDLSENYLCGSFNKEYKGLIYLMKKFVIKIKSFKCNFDKLNSEAFKIISNCLGVLSSIINLDLSDNQACFDPLNKYNTNGIAAIATCMSSSLHLKTLKLARNSIDDDGVELLANAINNMPNFQELDLSGNLCRIRGCIALQKTILNHSLFSGIKYLIFIYLLFI
jgi:Ran GTPase-activating protein (RanGAP) involved in mRNA processing and transport